MSTILSSVTAVTGQDLQRPLIHLRDGKNKLRLRLRRMAFDQELEGLPSNLMALVELLIQSRSRINGSVYETVAIWNKLRGYEKYWLALQFPSETAFLAHYCLPDGGTLATWTVMVKLFDKPTFILLGEQVLLYMMRSVEVYQNDPEERNKDYEAIFDHYCRQHDTFNRQAFFSVVRLYIGERYEKPMARAANVTHEEWLKRRNKRKNRSLISPIRPSVGQAPDFSVALQQPENRNLQSEHPIGYRMKEGEIIRSFIAYTKQLEAIVRNNLGEAALPEKPNELLALTEP